MKKIKIFFGVTVLLLITAGVFAGKKRFLTTSPLYILVINNYLPLTSTTSWSGFKATGIIGATISDDFGMAYNLYFNSGSIYYRAYADGW